MVFMFNEISRTVAYVIIVFLSLCASCMADMLNLSSSFEETFNDVLLGENGLYHFDGVTVFASGEVALTAAQAVGIELLGVIMTFRLIRNMLNNNPAKAESPVQVILPGVGWGIVIATMKMWVNAFLSTFFHPAAEILSQFQNFDLLEDLSEAVNSTTPSDTMVSFLTVSPTAYITADLLKALLIILIGLLLLSQFLPMLIDVARRYIVLFFLLIFGPVFFACGASEKEKLSGIALKYSKALAMNFIGFIIKLFFVSLSITASSNFFEAFIGSGSLSLGQDYTPYQLIGLFCIVLCTYRLGNNFGKVIDALGLGPSLGFDNQFGSMGEIGGTPARMATRQVANHISSNI